MADGVIQVPPDSSGKKVDTTELTRADGTIVERQRFVHPDPIDIDGDVARQILIELRVLTYLISVGFGIQDDLNRLRADTSFTDWLDALS